MEKDKAIKEIIQNLPQAPGVYKMKNAEGRVIYVGKAVNIRKRVKQYFKKGYEHSTRTKKLVENISDIEAVAVDTELEAIILETNLIKQLQPKYNILMKDDKNYVYIKITKGDFPSIKIVRQIEKDGAKYIGPKTAAHKIKETFKMLKKLFPFRHCGLGIALIDDSPIKKGDEIEYKVKITKKGIKYPCLDYYIKRCVAPCIGKSSKEEYAEIIKNVENFLEGKGEGILKSLNDKMHKLASEKKFEKAAKLRDRIQKVSDILEKQKVSDPNDRDKDIINYCITHSQAYFNLFQVREGKLIGQENFILKANELEENENQEVLEAFLQQYYSMTADLPKEILVPHKIDNEKEISSLLENEAGRKIKIIVPQKGKKHKLLELSAKNARIYADRNKPSWKEDGEINKFATERLQKILKLNNELKRIECYDISHLSGTDTVASMVVFKNGTPKNAHYRKFQIRTVKGKPDDFKSMEEVIYRRFNKIANEINFKDYKFKKATKSLKEEILTLTRENSANKSEEDYKNFHILVKDKKLAGCIAISEISDKVSFLNSLCVKEKKGATKIGHKILKEAAKKSKAKRVYIICNKDLLDYYAQIGFEEVKKIPKDILEKFPEAEKDKNLHTLVLDKIKLKEDQSFSEIPDLVIIDGGKGQLSSAGKVFKELGLKIPYISLAKRLEEIFQPGQKHSIQLETNNPALKLLQRARDEAHRFAITYNRKLRSKKLK